MGKMSEPSWQLKGKDCGMECSRRKENALGGQEGRWWDGEALGGWEAGGRLLGLNTIEARSLWQLKKKKHKK